MKNLIYRNIKKEDYPQIKNLINKAFGFYQFIKDEKFLDLVLNMYLQDCIIASSFSKIAEKDGKVIGIILGNSKKDKSIRKLHNLTSLSKSGLNLLFTNKENKKALKEFSIVHDTYKEIIKGRKSSFDGCIQLFIVSEESRGLGIGKTLLDHLFTYMKMQSVKSLYLYTDTRCNYKFYDSQNFKCLNEKELFFKSYKEKLTVFLYGYKFP